MASDLRKRRQTVYISPLLHLWVVEQHLRPLCPCQWLCLVRHLCDLSEMSYSLVAQVARVGEEKRICQEGRLSSLRRLPRAGRGDEGQRPPLGKTAHDYSAPLGSSPVVCATVRCGGVLFCTV